MEFKIIALKINSGIEKGIRGIHIEEIFKNPNFENEMM